jgi:uncharacterized protein (DUF1501 family)
MGLDERDLALSRRRFLQAVAASGALALTPELLKTTEAWARPYAPGENILVSMYLAGGNDGLNTVVPFTTGRYYDQRTTVNIAPSAALDLNGSLGLHPRLTKLRTRFDTGTVAIVQNVGFANQSQSHFVATAQWMGGHRSGLNPGSGWMGRYLDGLPGSDTFEAISFGSSVPLLMRGTLRRATSLPTGGSGSLWGSNRSARDQRVMFDTISAAGPVDTGLGLNANAIAQMGTTTISAAGIASPRYLPTVANSLAGQMTLVARFINADLGTRIFHVTQGGYDTHENQLTPHGNLMGALDDAVDAFFVNLAPQYLDRVTLVIWSEFGRPIYQNGSSGTDHGAAAPVMVVGNRVRGGLVGNPPNLSGTSRNLPFDIDFRNVYATMLDKWMAADSNAIIGSPYPHLDLFLNTGESRAPTPRSSGPGGYWLAASDGTVTSFGSVPALTVPSIDTTPVSGIAACSAGGAWLVQTNGKVSALGTAAHHGDLPALGIAPNQPVVGIASTASGNGYWLLGRDGGVFAFGDARFFGSTGSMVLNQPIVGMAAWPDGQGYWFVASDGGVFTYGEAQDRFFGSMGGRPLNRPIVSMAPTPSGLGYWLIASDGGVFAFGDAGFFGSTGSIALVRPIVSFKPTPTGQGYWFVASDGGVFAYGDAGFHGSAAGSGKTIVGMG